MESLEASLAARDRLIEELHAELASKDASLASLREEHLGEIRGMARSLDEKVQKLYRNL